MNNNTKCVHYVIFSVVFSNIEVITKVISEFRPNYKLVAVITAQGPKKRRCNSYLEIASKVPFGIDVIVTDNPNNHFNILQIYKPDLIICFSFPWLIRSNVLEIPSLGCINIHNGMLPDNRGPNATGWCFRLNKNKNGMTIHRMDNTFDTGRILAQKEFNILPNDFIEDVMNKEYLTLKELLPIALVRVENFDIGDPQVGDPTETPKFEDSYRFFDWKEPAIEIHNKIRGWIGIRDFPRGAIGEMNGQKINFLKSKIIDFNLTPPDFSILNQSEPGTILSQGPDSYLIKCGEGFIEIIDSCEL